MIEKLHQIVNGERIELTEEEKACIRSEWAQEDEKKALRIEERKEKAILKESAINKLISLGLTEDEIKIMNIK